ncbi:MAG: aspartate--tRNA ligase [Chloroflexi bacterium]|nr:aspartate--tRNA ligase [Chloroflexota bacterium]MDA1239793.1 aspartate--tRNA ligase [Chloroflexota bacterium]MQC47654.1 aspartate--tRNA ligase [Chloroflexota bacterium]
MLKTHGCGELRAEHAGQTVTLAGWVHRRRDHGGLVFIDLRDSTGLVQVVFHPDRAPAAFATASEVRSEFVLQIVGEVQPRRDGTENTDLPTGAIEVQAARTSVLNASDTPPFPVNQDTNVDELTRLRYRYLDLRRERMAGNIRLRHRVVKFMRDFMDAEGFIEVETPVLNLATPEGARDYLVPSRVHPGSFYALPQSPQQWKQLLMVGGIDRYFQIARCYRDEDLRGDRQPEFTQLDVEMAFVEESDILDLTERLYIALAAAVGPEFNLPSPFPRLTYGEAMERFGSDKPDLRYGLEIRNLSEFAAQGEFRVFTQAVEAGGRVRGFSVPGGADLGRRALDALTEVAKAAGASGLVWVQFAGEGPLDGIAADDIKSPAARFFTPEAWASIGQACGTQRGDLLLIAAGLDEVTSKVLDALRRQVAEDRALADPATLAFAFITEFPMFEYDAENERWSAVHHLFTSPFMDDLPLLARDPGSVRSHAYDLICNGQEIASGSIRIHSRDVQLQVLATLGLSLDEAREKFGHMLEAFRFGAPPHGGIAPGVDRTVALFAGERDIREVIAFPKTKSASDPMTGAPAPVAERQLRDVHIRLDEEALEVLTAAIHAADPPSGG